MFADLAQALSYSNAVHYCAIFADSHASPNHDSDRMRNQNAGAEARRVGDIGASQMNAMSVYK
jgi:hypothetical protein